MEERDEQLWRLARKRAGFRKSLISYFVINSFLWVIWWFTAGRHGISRRLPWPVWPMLGWGLGFAFQYFDAYGDSKQDMVEKEYEKLKREKEAGR
jgi:hypothetical protein